MSFALCDFSDSIRFDFLTNTHIVPTFSSLRTGPDPSVTVSNSIHDNPGVVLTPCLSIYGVVMTHMCSDPVEAGYLCDWYNYDYNGGECGATGRGFTINNTMTVPQDVEKVEETFASGMLGLGVHVAVSFPNEYCGYQEQEQEQYEEEEKEEMNEEAMNMAYVGAGVVFAIGTLSLFGKSRRQIATDEDENGQNFVEMKDTGSIAVV